MTERLLHYLDIHALELLDEYGVTTFGDVIRQWARMYCTDMFAVRVCALCATRGYSVDVGVVDWYRVRQAYVR